MVQRGCIARCYSCSIHQRHRGSGVVALNPRLHFAPFRKRLCCLRDRLCVGWWLVELGTYCYRLPHQRKRYVKSEPAAAMVTWMMLIIIVAMGLRMLLTRRSNKWLSN